MTEVALEAVLQQVVGRDGVADPPLHFLQSNPPHALGADTFCKSQVDTPGVCGSQQVAGFAHLLDQFGPVWAVYDSSDSPLPGCGVNATGDSPRP